MLRPLLTLFCAACFLPAAALAEGDPAPAPNPEPITERPVVYEPVTEHIFGGEEVEGRTKSPDGDWVAGRMGARMNSLIRIRTDFRAELLQTAQDL